MALPFEDDNFAEEFRDLDLSTAAIVSKEFEECIFVNCDFSEAQLRHCIFEDCRFLKCNMSVMKVDGSRFSNVVFEESKLSGIDWTKAIYSDILLDAPLTAAVVLSVEKFLSAALAALNPGSGARGIRFNLGVALRLALHSLPFVLALSAEGFDEEPVPEAPDLAVEGCRVLFLGTGEDGHKLVAAVPCEYVRSSGIRICCQGMRG